MSDRLEKYFLKKKIEQEGLPKMYMVYSSPVGVNKPETLQVVDICSCLDGITHKYKFDIVPYYIDLKDSEISHEHQGYGSGFGDLWSWTYFISRTKERADQWYQEELKRVTDKYLSIKEL